MYPSAMYIIKTILFSGMLTAYYWFVLRNKAFHQYNRFYLLATVVLSLTIPAITIQVTQSSTAVPLVQLLQVVNVPGNYPPDMILPAASNSVTPEQLAVYAYLLVCCFFLCAFIFSFIKIYRLYRQNEVQHIHGISLVMTEANGTPFSFFHWVFWNRNIDIQSASGQQILQHELAHVQQKHSLDKMVINVLLLFCWYNPFLWLIRKELSMIHEFTADKKAVEGYDTGALAAMILQAAYPKHRFTIGNSFFYSPIKRRLMMLTKKQHNRTGYFSRLMILPLAIIAFCAFTLTPGKQTVSKQYTGKKITVVIDAGHGGNDAGATDGNGLFEKDLTLAIAKKIKALNTNNAINIILSRETDIYQSPTQKADIINAAKADLAVVLHVDGTVKDSFELKSGMSAWVSKNDYNNSAASKIAASVLLQSFIANYPLAVSPSPLQRNNGILVLQASKCPAVLIETGYITNKKDAAFLNSAEGQEMIAKNILNGIEQFASIDKTAFINSEANTLTKKASATYIPQAGNAATATTTNSYRDPEKALFVVNGKVIGYKKEFEEKFKAVWDEKFKFVASITSLQPVEAIAKYGDAAKNGAWEIVTKSDNTTFINYNGMEMQQQLPVSRNISVTLNNVMPGIVPVDMSKGNLQLTCSNPSHKIKSYTVYFMGKSFPEMISASSNNDVFFSEAFAGNLQKIQAGDACSIDDIIVEDEKGEIKRSAPVSYTFTGDRKNAVSL